MTVNSVESLIGISTENSDKQNDEVNTILELSDILDITDVQILRRFYVTNEEFPNDTQPFCFPVLFMEMKIKNNLKIGMEALRKRIDNLVRRGLLEKVNNSNPTNYFPVRGKENLIRAAIARFFVLNGISKYM